MALLRIDFYSRYLKRNVMLTAVVPADKMDGDKLAKRRRGPYRTVYLLHGLLARMWIGLIAPMWSRQLRRAMSW